MQQDFDHLSLISFGPLSIMASSSGAAAASAVATADVLGLAATTSTSSPTAAAASTAADGSGEGAAAAQPIESSSSSSGHPPAVTGTSRAGADPTSKKNTSQTPRPNNSRGSSFNDDNDSAYEDVTDDDDDDDDTNDDEHDDEAALDEMSLFELISDRHFGAAIRRCCTHPAEARRWDSVPVGGGTGENATWSQCLPLHRACSLDPTPDLISALLAAHSDAVAERESYWGRLPLHVACLSGATYDAIQPLLQRYPQGGSVVAIHDRLPIHYACGGNAPRRIVLALLKIYPRGARCLDAYGWLPLHWAATFHKSPAVISAIIEAYPEALHKETNKGKTPFRCVRSSKQREIVDKGIDIAADRGIDVNPPRLFTTAEVKEEGGSANRGMRRRGSGVLGGGGMRRVDSSGSVGSLGASFSDIFGSLGRRKTRSGLSGGGTRSDLSTGAANASWDDVGGASNTGSSGYRRSSSRRDEPLRRRRRSSSRDAIARALGNLMNEDESNASLHIDETVLRGGHGSSSGGGSRGAIAAGSAELIRSRGSRREDNPPRGRRRRSSSQDAIARVIGKLMNSDQSLIDEDVIEKGETNALISEYVNPGDTAPEESGKDVTNEERVVGGQLGNNHRKSEPNLVVLNDVNDEDKDFSARARRGRRGSRSSDRSIDILESPVELTSRAAVDNCKEGAASSSRERDRQPRQTRRESAGGSRRRSGSIDAINRVIKAVGVRSFELVETDAADERPVMERKSSAKLE